MLQWRSGRICIQCICNSLYTHDLIQAKDPSWFPTQEPSAGEVVWCKGLKIHGHDLDSPTCTMTWVRSFNFLDFQVSPRFNELIISGYLRPNGYHEVQTWESKTLPGFRWPASLSYSALTFIGCYDRATFSHCVDEFWGLLCPMLMFCI